MTPAGRSQGATPARRIRLVAIPLLLISAFCAMAFIGQNGFSVFQWDDSEYLGSALDTFDHIQSAGFTSWPAYIVTRQHYGKPPLYVNLLTAGLVVTRRQHAVAAAALIAWSTTLALGAMVYGFIGRVAGERYGLLAALAILGMPSVGRWSPAAYPDILLVCLVVAVFWLIYTDVVSMRRAVLLGVVLGLGMLAKTTFPAFVGLPLLYWIWRGGAKRRLRVLLLAGFIAALLAAPWYVPNFREAVSYARNAYYFQPGGTRLERIWSWLMVLAGPGVGYCLLALSVIGWLLRRRSAMRMRPLAGDLPRMLWLGGAPLVLLAFTSSGPPNTRHPLPSLVLFGMALLFLIFDTMESDSSKRFARAVWFCMAGQWIATCAIQIPAIAKPLQDSPAGSHLASVLPGLPFLRAYSWGAVDDVMARAVSAGENGPRVWYLAGDDSMLNGARLQLAAKASHLPLQFEYACYFSWTAEQCRALLDQIRGTFSMVVLFTRPWEQLGPKEAAYNRYSRLAQTILDNPRNGFRKTAAVDRPDYSLSFYSASAVLPFTGPPRVSANFGGKIMLLDARLADRELLLQLRLNLPTPVNYKLMLHAHDLELPGSAVRVWDRYIDPPLSSWRAGETRILSFSLPEESAHRRYQLDLGFFDESDAAHQWPPLRLPNGQPALTVAADRLRMSGAP